MSKRILIVEDQDDLRGVLRDLLSASPPARSKADPDLKATPIIAVSSFAMKGDEEKARAAGCDHYVTKSYSPLQLLRTIRSARITIFPSALWVRLYERPACQAPRAFFLFSSFLSFLLFDRAAGFLPPRPRIVAGRRAQMLSRLAALQRPHPPGAWPLQQSSTTAGLMGRVDYAPVVYFIPSSCQRARYSDRGCFLAGPCYEVHGRVR